MKIKICLASALALAVLAVGACGDDDASDTSPGAETGRTTTEQGGTPSPGGASAVRAAKVEIVDFAYVPDPVTIQVGGKVIWLNQDSAPHTATAEDGSFDTGTLDEGKLKSESFKQAGTYPYVCSIHPSMHGTVEVVE